MSGAAIDQLRPGDVVSGRGQVVADRAIEWDIRTIKVLRPVLRPLDQVEWRRSGEAHVQNGIVMALIRDGGRDWVWIRSYGCSTFHTVELENVSRRPDAEGPYSDPQLIVAGVQP